LRQEWLKLDSKVIHEVHPGRLVRGDHLDEEIHLKKQKAMVEQSLILDLRYEFEWLAGALSHLCEQ